MTDQQPTPAEPAENRAAAAARARTRALDRTIATATRGPYAAAQPVPGGTWFVVAGGGQDGPIICQTGLGEQAQRDAEALAAAVNEARGVLEENHRLRREFHAHMNRGGEQLQAARAVCDALAGHGGISEEHRELVARLRRACGPDDGNDAIHAAYLRSADAEAELAELRSAARAVGEVFRGWGNSAADIASCFELNDDEGAAIRRLCDLVPREEPTS